MADNTKPALGDKPVEKLTHELESLNENVESLDDNIEASNKSQKAFPTFMRGVYGALGAAIGATIVLAIIIYILQKLAGVPFVGQLFNSVVHTIQK